ncbi:unnamed protein product [Peronospora effusa]|uniref:M-phase phosphoprotein 6 n=1 Tax=Peronospora effusa TaxID=542832 RepID=A0A3M6VVH8_9STRA|nr:hypothetical protein DD238_002930 [Peronospora effusa]RQM14874.1 hypothetical protein DD237_003064 [Peronospora effusa]CAI5724920.1 unnamed protein product [Peronospora effusa]
MWKPGTDRPDDTTPTVVDEDKTSTIIDEDDEEAPIKGKDLPSHMTKKTPSKFVLSQKTLAMKFMQRKKTTEAQRISAVKKQHTQDTWGESVPEEDEQTDDGSEITCTRDVPDPSLPLLFGRRSFGSFNKGVEDEFKEASRALRFAASEETELREEVSAEEMTSRMLKYTGLSRRSGTKDGGRHPHSNKRQRK